MFRLCLPSLMCLSLAAAPIDPVERPAAGPNFPPMKGVEQMKPCPYWVSWGIQAVLRDVPSAVVTVEETYQPILSRPLPPSFRFPGTGMKVRSGRPSRTELEVPTPEWNDASILRNSAGNIVHRMF